MKVTVDPARCQGHARCWDICPEVFTLNDEGNAEVSVPEVPAGLEGAVEKAVANCPERAISLA